MQSREVMQTIINNEQIAAVVAATGGATGLATVLQWLPPLVGLVGSILAAVLTVVLIWSHITKTRAEVRRSTAQAELAEKKVKDLIEGG